jgi:hypothetical protein
MADWGANDYSPEVNYYSRNMEFLKTPKPQLSWLKAIQFLRKYCFRETKIGYICTM